MAKARLGANLSNGRRVDMEITFDQDHPEDVVIYLTKLAEDVDVQTSKFLDQFSAAYMTAAFETEEDEF
jgi:hypothetical protein